VLLDISDNVAVAIDISREQLVPLLAVDVVETKEAIAPLDDAGLPTTTYPTGIEDSGPAPGERPIGAQYAE
jgi:hypothetical protein